MDDPVRHVGGLRMDPSVEYLDASYLVGSSIDGMDAAAIRSPQPAIAGSGLLPTLTAPSGYYQ